MPPLLIWLRDIDAWYKDEERTFTALGELVKQHPAELFSSPFSQDKSDALAYFFDACDKLYRHEEGNGSTQVSYSFLQFSYAKLQQLASYDSIDLDVRRWSVKRLDRVIVTMMEFCQRQGSDEWLRESESLVELHISFMLNQSESTISQPFFS